jgi:hypothetical protein
LKLLGPLTDTSDHQPSPPESVWFGFIRLKGLRQSALRLQMAAVATYRVPMRTADRA